MALLRFWFSFHDPVPPRTYFRHGVGLMALKYAGDVALVFLAMGRWWTPLDYLRSVGFLLSRRFEGAPSWLVPALAVWALPFIWIGVTLTLRRVLDAGISVWLTLLYFIPFINYLMMLALSFGFPTRPVSERERADVAPGDRTIPEALLAIAAGLGLALAMLVVSVLIKGAYGVSLLLGTPVLVGVVTAFLFNRRHPGDLRDSFQVVILTVALATGVIFLLGGEGAICLGMMLPLTMALALMGAVLGHRFARAQPGSTRSAALSVLALPLSTLVLPQNAEPIMREVRSSIEISAPADVVWRNVIAFPPIPEPGGLLFRTGIAYPKSARIEGEGVGAVRYCVFSTGAFVEPITAWEPGRRLSFEVRESPAPMQEWSIYSHLTPPHLDGYLASRRGEFRLVALPGGRTRLEGSTWYQLRIEPQGYWTLFSDYLIHRIHLRVLAHIQHEAEAGQ
jgi:uncharacterized membrane protein YhaH (DUF805 family)